MTERGSAPIELAVGILVLLVPVALLVLSFGPALERRVLARSLAVDVARTLVVSGGAVSIDSVFRFGRLIESSGVSPAAVRVGVCGNPARPIDMIDECPLGGRSAVEVVVDVEVPPWLLGGPEMVSHTHSEPLDPYRSTP
ncbi:MAG: hypothetical protein WD532_03550 [Acidimicrobiia bacterium]